MPHIHNSLTRSGLVLAGLVIAAAHSAQALVGEATQIDLSTITRQTVLAPTTENADARTFRLDLMTGEGWGASELHLFSSLSGQAWSAASSSGLRFAGFDASLSALSPVSTIDSSLNFIEGGFLTPGDWQPDQVGLLAFSKSIQEKTYYGALLVRLDQEHALTVLNWGLDEGQFDAAGLQPIPENNLGILLAGLTGLIGAVLLNRRRSQRVDDLLNPTAGSN